MIIEYTNAKPASSRSGLAIFMMALMFVAFFVPTSLTLLGFLSSQPTGSLLSPLPEGVVSQTPTIASIAPIVAAPNEDKPSTPSSQQIDSNLITKSASISAGLTEATIQDAEITPLSQIFLSPRKNDSQIYYVKSKSTGQFVLASPQAVTIDSVVDYHIVNP